MRAASPARSRMPSLSAATSARSRRATPARGALRVHAARPVTAEHQRDGRSRPTTASCTNNFAGVQLRVDNLVDLPVAMASGGVGRRRHADRGPGGAAFERPPDGDGRHARHRPALRGHVAVGDHPQWRGRATLLDPQRARCALPALARNAQLFVDYRAEFAGARQLRRHVHGRRRRATRRPDNDSLTRPVLVRPYNDIAVAGVSRPAAPHRRRAARADVHRDRRPARSRHRAFRRQ